MATRRVDGVAFDTGVLGFAASGPTFLAALEDWAANGDVRVDADRWRGVPTMRSLPTALAERCGATVETATTVTSLAVSSGRWEVRCTKDAVDRTVTADALVLTAPAAQSLALLSDPAQGHERDGQQDGELRLASDATLAALAGVEVVPTFTVLARPSAPHGTATALVDPSDAALATSDLTHCRVRHAADDAPAALTLHADAAFSASALDGDRDAAARELAAQASALVGTGLVVVHVHGWRYAQVAAGIDRPALRDDTAGAPLVLAGDLFEAYGDAPEGVRPEGVERAFHSGRAAAALLDAAGHERSGDGEGP